VASRLLVFDLDGTLVDSRRDLAAATNAALKRVVPEVEPVPVHVVTRFVGEGARLLIERSLRHAHLDLPVDDVLPIFFECYGRCLLDTTRLYPGLAEALDALQRTKLAVLTNKPGNFSRTILEGLGVASRFARIWGAGDVPERKPASAGLARLVGELGVGTDETWMVGDSAIDVATARAGGVRVAGVTWGFNPEALRAAGPDRLIGDPAELTSLVAG
jgi:phosphoglycolate phosphatase